MHLCTDRLACWVPTFADLDLNLDRPCPICMWAGHQPSPQDSECDVVADVDETRAVRILVNMFRQTSSFGC